MRSAPLEPVFFSTYPYAACKVVGAERWPTALQYELDHLDESYWPGFRTLGQMLRICDAELMFCVGTYITRARNVVAKKFLASGKDVWVTVDDDMLVEQDELRRLVQTCRATRRGVVMPYLNRDGKSMVHRKLLGPTRWIGLDGGATSAVRGVDRAGLGCAALHRELIEFLADGAPHFAEQDNVPSPVLDTPMLFLEGVSRGSWVGEDYYFSSLCQDTGRPLDIMLDAPATHENLHAMLDLDGNILLSDPAQMARLDASLRANEQRFSSEEPGTDPSPGVPLESIGD